MDVEEIPEVIGLFGNCLGWNALNCVCVCVSTGFRGRGWRSHQHAVRQHSQAHLCCQVLNSVSPPSSIIITLTAYADRALSWLVVSSTAIPRVATGQNQKQGWAVPSRQILNDAVYSWFCQTCRVFSSGGRAMLDKKYVFFLHLFPSDFSRLITLLWLLIVC